jgi:hypothetical protein
VYDETLWVVNLTACENLCTLLKRSWRYTVAIDSKSIPVICSPVTREEIEQRMDELARESAETHDPEIPEEIYELARGLGDGTLTAPGFGLALFSAGPVNHSYLS